MIYMVYIYATQCRAHFFHIYVHYLIDAWLEYYSNAHGDQFGAFHFSSDTQWICGSWHTSPLFMKLYKRFNTIKLCGLT